MLCRLLYDPRFLEHLTPQDHHESPRRLDAVISAVGNRTWLQARVATDQELLRGHTPAHLKRVLELSRNPGWVDTGTYCHDMTAEVARLAVGGCLRLAEMILEGGCQRGMALVRPPGHHAETELVEGYCFFSNLGLTAHHLHSLGLNRILALDWDVHHGNGTQSLLSGKPWARFIDLHQHPLYPGTGLLEDRGGGSVFNLPLPAGLGNEIYLYLLEHVVEPLVKEFDPEFLLVSAGFDAHHLDPLGGMNLSARGFAEMTDRLIALANECSAKGRLMLVLEGGYHTAALAESVQAVVERLENPASGLVLAAEIEGPSETVVELVERARLEFGL